MLKTSRVSHSLRLTIGALALLVVCVAALAVGRSGVGWSALATGDPAAWSIVGTLRLPRVLIAALVGAGLGVAGLAAQTALRNPLASPDVLGVGAGAGVGACLALVWGLPSLGVVASAFGAGMGVTALVARVSQRAARASQRDPVLVALLVGMAISSFAAALIAAIKWVADPMGKLPTITFWMLGSLAAVSWSDVLLVLACAVLAAALLCPIHRALAALSLGDDVAQTMGVPVARLRWRALFAMALLAAAAASVAGLVPWVALLVPHAARMLLRERIAQPWQLTALLGALSVVVVDTVCRSAADTELPLGVLLSVLGVPAFLWLVAHRTRP